MDLRSFTGVAEQYAKVIKSFYVACFERNNMWIRNCRCSGYETIAELFKQIRLAFYVDFDLTGAVAYPAG